MKRALFLSLFVLLVSVGHTQSRMVLKGFYKGKNIYIQNPISGAKGQFCIVAYPVVNGSVTTRLVKSSALEIDLSKYGLKIGDPVEIVIEHSSGCLPKVLNMEAIE